MVEFLIKRPIAVFTTFLALLLVGLTTMGLLPVSMLPTVDIPEITILVDRPESSARELESTIVQPLRRQLNQVGGIEALKCATNNGHAEIQLRFKYGVSMDMAYIEVNEKIDGAMGYLPRDMDRPRVIKASATDLPVFYLTINYRDTTNKGVYSADFAGLGDFCANVIKKRLEQLPDVAIADITGIVKPEIVITPKPGVTEVYGITAETIRRTLESNNVTLGNVVVRDGYYQYNVRLSSGNLTSESIGSIVIKVGTRILRLSDICTINTVSQNMSGLYVENGIPSINIAVIKQQDSRMDDLQKSVDQLLSQMKKEYPTLAFKTSRDQTMLLSYTISNLKQNLWFGGFLAFLVMFFFLKDTRTPLIIGITIPMSLVISMLVFYLTNLTINVISLSGLILGIGMIVDNSIIVIDNITQHVARRESLFKAIVKGTSEVIIPMLSAVLTTCSVFLPLVYLSGMAGALFTDQAMSVSIGLFVSLVLAITLIPVIYLLLYRKSQKKWFTDRWLERMTWNNIENFYGIGYDFFFRHKGKFAVVVVGLLVAGFWLFKILPQERMPQTRETALVLHIDYNRNLHPLGTATLLNTFMSELQTKPALWSGYIGANQFVMSKESGASASEANLYIEATDEKSLAKLKLEITTKLGRQNEVSWEIGKPENIIEKVFEKSEAPLVLHVSKRSTGEMPTPTEAIVLIDKVAGSVGYRPSEPVLQNIFQIEPNVEKCRLYGLEPSSAVQSLKTVINRYQISKILNGSDFLPVSVSLPYQSLKQALNNQTIMSAQKTEIPLKALLTVSESNDYKTITSTAGGEALEMQIFAEKGKEKSTLEALKTMMNSLPTYDYFFTGSYFSNQIMIRELLIVMLISLALLYFILAAQFESFVQPLIVMIEIPIDITGALFFLWLWGSSINIMSLIGIVVMAGIVINDSILKIDTINHLRKDEGLALDDAIHEAGKRRFKAILMTSLTTIIALVPFFFSHDVGSEMQMPLALALFGSMTLGTFISLYFVPIVYWWVYRVRK